MISVSWWHYLANFGKSWRWAKHVSLFRQDFSLLGEMHLERSRRFTRATRRAAGIRQFIRLRKPRQAAADPQIRCLEVLQNEKFREMTSFLAPKARRSYLKRKLSRHKIRTEGFTGSLTKTWMQRLEVSSAVNFPSQIISGLERSRQTHLALLCESSCGQGAFAQPFVRCLTGRFCKVSMAGSPSGTPNPRIKTDQTDQAAHRHLWDVLCEVVKELLLPTFGENNKVKRCQEMSRGQGQKATNVSAFDKHPGWTPPMATIAWQIQSQTVGLSLGQSARVCKGEFSNQKNYEESNNIIARIARIWFWKLGSKHNHCDTSTRDYDTIWILAWGLS